MSHTITGKVTNITQRSGGLAVQVQQIDKDKKIKATVIIQTDNAADAAKYAIDSDVTIEVTPKKK